MSSPRIIPIREMTAPEPSDALYSLVKVRQLLHTNTLNVYRLARRRQIRSTIVGRQKKYLSQEVDELAARLEAGDAEALRAGITTPAGFRGPFGTAA